MTTTINPTAIIKAIVAADRAAGTLFAKCAAVAELAVADHDPRQPFDAEYKRLMTGLKDLIKETKTPIKNRNIWLFIGQHVTIAMAPDTDICVAEARGKEGAATYKPAEACKTTREVATAAKQIREQLGASDGRASNGRKASAATHNAATGEAETEAATLAERLRNDAALREQLEKLGIVVSVVPTKAKQPKRKVVSKPAAKPAPEAAPVPDIAAEIAALEALV